jgi:DNA primase
LLTLETGFDPDLFIRRQGKDAYGARSEELAEVFRLSDRSSARPVSRAKFADSKVKAVNLLLPHIQRVPNRIVRDELALEISQKLGIDSAVLRQELKHAATTRSASPGQSRSRNANHRRGARSDPRSRFRHRDAAWRRSRSSARDGTDEEFDPFPPGAISPSSQNISMRGWPPSR